MSNPEVVNIFSTIPHHHNYWPCHAIKGLSNNGYCNWFISHFNEYFAFIYVVHNYETISGPIVYIIMTFWTDLGGTKLPPKYRFCANNTVNLPPLILCYQYSFLMEFLFTLLYAYKLKS